MTKQDRLIILFSIGIMLISCAFSLSAVHKQNVRKHNQAIEMAEKEKAETINIMIWKKYHQDQMIMMNRVLSELKNQKSVSPACSNL